MYEPITDAQLLEVAERFGTPTYVYHAEKIAEQYNRLKQAFSGHPTRIFYACKALTNINILKYLKGLGSSIDCVSIGEVQLALRAGYDKNDILFTPNCVDFDEIVEGTKLGVNINIDNISILEKFGHEFGSSYPICIRINPHIEAGGNYKISTGHVDSKFGISYYQMRHIERVVKATGLQVKGLHMHTGSEIKDVSVFMRGLEIMFEIARESHFKTLEYLDLGSGFKVPYKDDEIGTDVEDLGKQLTNAVREFEKEYGRSLEIWFEPGKFLVSEAGSFIVKTNVIKQTPATVFVGVDSGFNHLIRPMFYESYHKITNLNNPNGTKRIYTVVGNICETDTFAWDRVISEVHEGDVLRFHNAGAYCFMMSSNFNSRMKPAEVLFIDGEFKEIRKRDEFEDLLHNQVEVL
ncbi:MAG: diaminopimelate decarboxylase [Chitinophagales bacterium]|nr:diaminopimelate decarboxylase [Chitinophagaceae bacterium]MCB9063821.1 diaminopimelate decarboxylase [Chitinophagales bacterium]